MMERRLKIYLALALGAALILSADVPAIAKGSKKSKTKAKKVQTSRRAAKKKPQTLDERFVSAKRAYRTGAIPSGKFWQELTKFEQSKSRLSKTHQVSLGEIQAAMLMADKFPILAGLYARDVIKSAKNPLKAEYRKAWYVLSKVNQRRSMQDVVEGLAGNLKLGAKVPPYFGTDWFYYEGNAESSIGRAKSALQNYGRLQLDDRHYMSAKYQTAMIHVEAKEFKKAESALKAMLNAANYSKANLPEGRKRELGNYAKIGLARLFYQQQKFKSAIAFYRAVDRDSEHFYDALFEQSWAFFMAGYPNHALGAIHGVESPFYKDIFNPEASMLRSIIYYWMCRYDDSRAALADFTERNADDVEALGDYLKRKRFSNAKAYSLFENHISGVSGSSLGLSKRILSTAATEDTMLLLRDQIAYTVNELERLENKGVYGNKVNKVLKQRLKRRVADLQDKLGGQFLVELRSMRTEYEQMYEQAQFLYIELLMSEKEQLLGRELHASSKMDRVTRRKKIVGWSKDNQAWSGNNKNEFWWDEVGYYIYDVQPLCKSDR